MSVLDIWGAEYQENDAMLIKPDSVPVIARICERERLPFSVVGEPPPLHPLYYTPSTTPLYYTPLLHPLCTPST
eukprot:3836685-Pyramimonas_sp.AAC.1